MKIYYFPILLIASIFLTSCQDNTYEEYFCEDLEIGSENSSTMYFQSNVKISDSEMCIYHRGKEFCTAFDKKADGYVDKADWDKNLLHSEINISSRNGEKYIFEIFERNEIRQDVKVESRLINNEWHFSFQGKELKSILPLKDATDEAMLVFKVAAIENKVYGYIAGDFVPKLTASNSSGEKSEKPANEYSSYFEEPNKETLFFYGNEKYNEIKSYIEGNHLGATYTFNKTNMTLTYTPSNPFKTDGKDGIFRYKCQAWKRQRWYEFP